jgi:hypothetical protein
MGVRSWTVGVMSTAAVVTGVVAVQSGIPDPTALPILPHRAVAPAAAGGSELPAPVEVSAPSPGAGTVQQAPVARAEVVSQRRSAADLPATDLRHSGGDADERSDEADRHDRSGKGPGKDSDGDSGKGSDKRPDGGPGQD